MSEGVVIAARVTPRSSRSAIGPPGADGALRVRVTAPPADGAANRAVVKLIAAELHIPKGRVRIVAGETSRTKRVRLEGVSGDQLLARWPGLAVATPGAP